MFVKCGLEDKAYQIYIEIKQKYNINPDFRTTNCIIGYLIRIMKVEEVFEIITPYIGTSRISEEIMWTVLLHSSSELNDKEKCNRLFEVDMKLFQETKRLLSFIFKLIRRFFSFFNYI